MTPLPVVHASARAGAVLVIALLAPPLVLGQEILLAPGSQVRVVDGARRLGGVLVRLANDTVEVSESAGTSRSLALSSSGTVSVRMGTQRMTRRGGRIGLVAGMAAGVFVGLALHQPRCGPGAPATCVDIGPAGAALAGGAAVGLVGGITGALIGRGMTRDVWRAVPRSEWPRIAIAPSREGMTLAVGVSF